MIKKLLIFAAIAMLFVGVQAGTASADLVLNGSFQTGDFTNWTQSGDNTFSYVSTASTGAPAGSTEAMLGTNGSNGTISQTINTTVGQAYTVSFWLASDDFLQTPTTYFKALWNGAVETTNPGLPSYTVGAFDYTQFVFTGIATSANTTLAFNYENDNAGYHLTDISAATATPIPATVWLFWPSAGLAG